MLAGEGGIEDRGVVIGVPGADIHTGIKELGAGVPIGFILESVVFTGGGLGGETPISGLFISSSCIWKY